MSKSSEIPAGNEQPCDKYASHIQTILNTGDWKVISLKWPRCFSDKLNGSNFDIYQCDELVNGEDTYRTGFLLNENQAIVPFPQPYKIEQYKMRDKKIEEEFGDRAWIQKIHLELEEQQRAEEVLIFAYHARKLVDKPFALLSQDEYRYVSDIVEKQRQEALEELRQNRPSDEKFKEMTGAIADLSIKLVEFHYDQKKSINEKNC